MLILQIKKFQIKNDDLELIRGHETDRKQMHSSKLVEFLELWEKDNDAYNIEEINLGSSKEPRIEHLNFDLSTDKPQLFLLFVQILLFHCPNGPGLHILHVFCFPRRTLANEKLALEQWVVAWDKEGLFAVEG